MSSLPQTIAALVQSLELTISQDQSQLRDAQLALEIAAASDLASYLLMLSEILADKKNSQVARMAAALQLKNHLVCKESSRKVEFRQKWLQFQESIRHPIKKNVLLALGTEPAAAQCVAYIASAELPVNQWPELIPLFITKASNNSIDSKEREAIMESIGFICQEISTNTLAKFSNEILQTIVNCIGKDQPDHKLGLAATNALSNSIELLQHHFDNKNERNCIMQVICDATQSNDVDLCVASLQCLIKLASMYYPYFEEYMDVAVVNITLAAMNSAEANASLQGIEFWMTIAEIELNLALEAPPIDGDEAAVVLAHWQSKSYVKNYLSSLVPALFEVLSRKEDCDDDEDWVPCKAAALCLMDLSHCSGDIAKHVLPLTYRYIKRSEWRNRKSGAIALGCIAEGWLDADQHEMEAVMPFIWNLTKDENSGVRESAVWCIGRILEFLPQLVPARVQVLVDGLVVLLADSDPRVALSTCWTISALVTAAYKTATQADRSKTPENFVLSPYYAVIIDEIIKKSVDSSSNSSKLRTTCYEVLRIVLGAGPTDCYAILESSVGRLVELLNATTMAAEPDEDLQSLLSYTVTDAAAQLSSSDAARMADSTMAPLMAILKTCPGFDRARAVHEDAFISISAITRILGPAFSRHVDGLLPVLVQALSADADHTMNQLSISLTGDVFRVLNTVPSDYLDRLMPCLLAFTVRDVDLKTCVELVAVFGDIALSVGSQFQPYVSSVADWMQKLLLGTKGQRDSNDQSDTDDQLRENCLVTYTNFIEGLKNNGSHTLLEPYLSHICKVVMATLSEDSLDGVVSAAAALIRHLVVEFGGLTSPELDINLIKTFLRSAIESTERSDRTHSICQWTQEQIESTATKKEGEEVDR